MLSPKDHLTALSNTLAPYAVPFFGMLGREHPEADDPLRSPFQRDRGRIINSQAFRRLKGKTQVFIATHNDHYRTRLTHTMEVAQVSRDVARWFGLNEDLAECIALAHDMGHPPFGHAGEEALDTWMQEHGLHFEHNAQSLRLVRLLEKHSTNHAGLNLSIEVLEGLMKHRTAHGTGKPGIDLMDLPPRSLSLEAQVVNLSDQIAYTGHDFDDGLRSGLFLLEEAKDIPLVAEAAALSQKTGALLRSSLIGLMIRDLTAHSMQMLSEQNIQSLDDVYAATNLLIGFSDDMRQKMQPVRDLLWDRIYKHSDVVRKNEQGQQVILTLCRHFYEHPSDRIEKMQERSSGTAAESVKDYVAGMTDSYAIGLYKSEK